MTSNLNLGDLLFTSCVSQKSRQDLINLVYAVVSYFLSIIYFTQPVSGVKKQQKKRNFGSRLFTMPRESVSQSECLERIFFIIFPGAPNGNIVQNHLNIALLNAF